MRNSSFILLFILALSGIAGCGPTESKQAAKPLDPVASDSKLEDEVVEPSKDDIESTVKGNYPSLSKTVVVGKAAPDFEIKDEKGKTWHLSDYKGKTILLDFWAFW